MTDYDYLRQVLLLTADGRTLIRVGQMEWLVEQKVCYPVTVLGEEAAAAASIAGVEYITHLPMDRIAKLMEQRPDLAVCDFCSAREVKWLYPARSFKYSAEAFRGQEGSRGVWLACSDCYSLIQRGQRDALSARCEDAHFEREGYPESERPIQLHTIKHQHSDFWANREGAPQRVGRPKVEVSL